MYLALDNLISNYNIKY